MGLYYVLHIGKLRNKNALQRLLHSLGKSESDLVTFRRKKKNDNNQLRNLGGKSE